MLDLQVYINNNNNHIKLIKDTAKNQKITRTVHRLIEFGYKRPFQRNFLVTICFTKGNRSKHI